MVRVSEWSTEYVEMRTRLGELTGKSPGLNRHTLRQFARLIDDPPAGELTRGHIEAWLGKMTVRESTKRTALSIVRQFCQWLVIHDVLGRDPCLGIKGPREPRTVVHTLSPEQIRRVLEVGCPDARARLVVILQHQEGLRIGSIASLQGGDVDEVNRLVFVVGKGGQEQILPVTREAVRALRVYLAEHPPIAGPLIRSYRYPNRGVGAHYLSCLVSAWMYAAGVKERPRDGKSSHALRRTAATEIAENCNDPRVLRDFLGHSNMNSLHRYLARMKAEKLREAMEGRDYLTGSRNLLRAGSYQLSERSPPPTQDAATEVTASDDWPHNQHDQSENTRPGGQAPTFGGE